MEIPAFAANTFAAGTGFGGGRINKTNNSYDINYFITDHLGSTRAIVNANGSILEQKDYYPFGKEHENANLMSSTNRWNFSGKEKQTIRDLGWLDFSARMLETEIGRWFVIDPLAEKYYSVSPYAFCSNNPVNRIDPDGRADFWHNGKVIGNDGVDDKRILAIKTTEKSFGSNDNNSFVEGAGLSKKDLNATVKFITANSGNAEAFQNNGIAYTNSMAIESSADNRQAMVNEVSKDNGKGGMSDANNREYGGSISNGTVTVETAGSISSPGNSASIALPVGVSTFHSHPSGSSSESSTPANSTGSTVSFGGTVTSRGYVQSPSPQDINNAGGHTNYVFGRGNNTVYIYNSNGVQAIIPMKYFVTPKR
jgi:RHS repeat-associated protein